MGSLVVPGGRMVKALRFVLAVNCGQAKDGDGSALATALAWPAESVWLAERAGWGSEAEVFGGVAVSRFRVS